MHNRPPPTTDHAASDLFAMAKDERDDETLNAVESDTAALRKIVEEDWGSNAPGHGSNTTPATPAAKSPSNSRPYIARDSLPSSARPHAR